MKQTRLILFILALAILWAEPAAFAKPPKITFSGGDGSSLEKAIVIKGATEETGVHAESEYIEKRYPNYRRGGQSLRNSKDRAYDVLDFTTADGKKKTIYFDITAFFGK